MSSSIYGYIPGQKTHQKPVLDPALGSLGSDTNNTTHVKMVMQRNKNTQV